MSTDLSFFHLILGASVVVKLVLLLLLVVSMVSWTMIFRRRAALIEAQDAADDFEDRFWAGGDLGTLYRELSAGEDDAIGMAGIFQAGFSEFARLRKQTGSDARSVVEGAQRVMRVVLSRGFSLLFARSSAPLGFSAPPGLDKLALQGVIDAKVALLARLDPAADEALFSPALKHWLGQPLDSCRYQWLAEREASMVGARAAVGVELRWARRIHMLAALGFYLGLLAHVIVMLFFAGYAAAGADIDWWYITAWGS